MPTPGGPESKTVFTGSRPALNKETAFSLSLTIDSSFFEISVFHTGSSTIALTDVSCKRFRLESPSTGIGALLDAPRNTVPSATNEASLEAKASSFLRMLLIIFLHRSVNAFALPLMPCSMSLKSSSSLTFTIKPPIKHQLV